MWRPGQQEPVILVEGSEESVLCAPEQIVALAVDREMDDAKNKADVVHHDDDDAVTERA
ncbi:hypothetical protein SCP_0301740 [Sparassis crispa]|uniref:Uncharacterized protein n=1 Tax=Sparassis crispa TaxID=139825 RepID=A0A401GE56_9APHY|nr:hypothetical protein SCP_0301740 [Sparassis crispa]GBE80459.1 hypothetical protein SCP_0301740 [Sparassis crispa]